MAHNALFTTVQQVLDNGNPVLTGNGGRNPDFVLAALAAALDDVETALTTLENDGVGSEDANVIALRGVFDVAVTASTAVETELDVDVLLSYNPARVQTRYALAVALENLTRYLPNDLPTEE